MIKFNKKSQSASTRADQIPEELIETFIHEMRNKGTFWGDMATLTVDLALRNIECRELTVDHYDPIAKTLSLYDSKQVKSWHTKHTNKRLAELWLSEAVTFLYNELKEVNPTLAGLALGSSDISVITTCAKVADLTDQLEQERIQFYEENKQAVAKELINHPKLPTGRVIQLDGLTRVIEILDRRTAQAKSAGSEFLFNCCELKGNRAAAKGFAPVSRQAVYRVIKTVRELMRKSSNKALELLRGLRISLHSARKSGIQLIAKASGLTQASEWVGHGSVEVTSSYLDKSEQKKQRTAKAINEVIAMRYESEQLA